MNTQRSRRRSLTIVCTWATLSLVGANCSLIWAQGEKAEDTSPFAAASEQMTPEAAKTPLQRFELGQLKLVGVIWEANEPKALIEDSGGLGYIATRGTPIGAKGGVIKAIEAKRVVVEEYQTDFYGKRQVQERELQLFVADSAQEGKTKKVK